EYTPAACALIRDAFGRVPGYIQMLDEHMAEERARSRALEVRVKELEGSQKQWGRGQASWAHVAPGPGQRDGSTPLQGNQGSMNPTEGSMNMKKLDGAKMRRVTVRIRDEGEKEVVSAANKEDLVKAFRNAANGATGDIVAVYTKPAGDVVLITASVEGREALERGQEWATEAYSSAEVLRQTFPVIIHGVKKSAVKEEKQSEAIAKIIAENKRLHPDLQVVR
ncbi:MAG: hypothetical protein L6R37_008476, partial [Teloschistes peruensis]